MGDAVEQGAGETLAGEDRGPFLEGQVGGDDGGTALARLPQLGGHEDANQLIFLN